jgi:ParB/RepB/Spo0J family partition protein
VVAGSRALEQLGEALMVRKEPQRPVPRTAVVALPLDLIVEPPRERRIRTSVGDVDQELDLSKLCESLQQHGLLHPIGCRALADGRFEVVYGSRRLAAARRLGWTSIQTSLHLNMSEEPALLAGLAENLHRADLAPRELAASLRLLAQLHTPGTQLGGSTSNGHAAIQPPKRQPGSAGDLARKLSVDVGTIIRLAALGRDEDLLGLVEAGELGLTAASHVARVPVELRSQVLEQVQQANLSANATHQHVNRVLRERRVPTSVSVIARSGPSKSVWRLRVALGMLSSIELQGAGDVAEYRVVLDDIAGQVKRLRAEAAKSSRTTVRALA